MTNKTTTERRPANSPRSEQPTNLPTSYTTSWDLTPPTLIGRIDEQQALTLELAAPPRASAHRRLQPPSRAILLSTLVGVLLAIPGAMVALRDLRGDPPPGVSAIAEVTVIADVAAGGCVPSKHGGARAEHR